MGREVSIEDSDMEIYSTTGPAPQTEQTVNLVDALLLFDDTPLSLVDGQFTGR